MTDSPATPEPAVRTRTSGRHTQSTFQLSMGDLLASSFSIYLRNLPAFVLLGVFVQAPWIAALLYYWQNPPSSVRTYQLIALGLQVLSGLLTILLTGAVTFGVVQQMRGVRAGFAASVGKGMSSFLRVLGTGILCGLRIFLFCLLLIVPGIIEAMRLFVAIPASVMEGKVGTAAAERSVRLTLGSRWALFGAWMFTVLLSAGLGMLSGFLEEVVARNQSWVPLATTIGIALLVNPLGATIAAVAYFQLRRGKENVDVRELAAVFA